MQKLRIHFLLHAKHEDPGYIWEFIRKYDHSSSSTRLFLGESLPDLNTFDVLIAMGGPMGVYDTEQFPWLEGEKKFIIESIGNNKKIIGICLGSQLLANALGSKVFKNRHTEIGFFRVLKKTRNALFEHFPEQAIVFHWHGDTYDLPEGAELVMSSEACTNQAFLYKKNILALQFHIEVTVKLINEFLKSGSNDLQIGNFVQTEEEIRKNYIYIPACNSLLEELLKNFLNDA
jgi:GMP synthase-like glutamine amidotransferase